jgi:hypothetical protein
MERMEDRQVPAHERIWHLAPWDEGVMRPVRVEPRLRSVVVTGMEAVKGVTRTRGWNARGSAAVACCVG